MEEGAMKRVSVEEFRDNVSRYLVGMESVVVECDGRTVGHYLPTKRVNSEESRKAIDELERTAERILAETGMTEDELADLFDFKKPLPDEFGS
jgi:hypothetical protein